MTKLWISFFQRCFVLAGILAILALALYVPDAPSAPEHRQLYRSAATAFDLDSSRDFNQFSRDKAKQNHHQRDDRKCRKATSSVVAVLSANFDIRKPDEPGMPVAMNSPALFPSDPRSLYRPPKSAF